MCFLNRLSILVAILLLAGCGGVPTHDRPGASDVKNYDRSHYERFSSEDESLYDRLGGREVIAEFVDDAVERILVDERIAHLFEDSDIPNLKFQLTDQICLLAGGPCEYRGLDMESAHRGLDINEAEFNALVEDFQWAMRANDVPYGLENQVLALLAPMKPAVIHQ
ncbi:MAG: group 1 truncated hemoglobin [Xanthomonadales bacterium]|nr:group 1 truncated hemoglobin [Xanthomonadales bacterium]